MATPTRDSRHRSWARAAAARPVVYIEDDETNVVLVRALVRAIRALRCCTRPPGREGVLLVRRERPDFVLLDMNLPDISGLEVVRELNIDITSRGLRLNILTGNALSMDIIKAMSLGAYEYWLKPLTRQVFDDGLRRALTGRRPDPAHRIPVR
jgi:DNA-binding response OmpR family regulator